MLRGSAVAWLGGALLAASFVGCASTAFVSDWPAQSLPEGWEARRAALQGWDRFELEGRVSVVSVEDGLVAGWIWRQRAARTQVDLQGPAGLGARRWQFEAAEDDRPEGVALADWRAWEAALGVPLPVTSMRYWLLGVPHPSRPAEETLLAGESRLVALVQDGWEIRFLDYAAVGAAGVALPSRLELTRESSRVRLVVRVWRGVR